MIRYKSRNTIWLAALSALMALVLLSGNLGAEVQAALVGVYLLIVTATFIDVNALTSARGNVVNTIRAPLNRTRMSPEAREASARAQARSGVRSSHLQLADIGVIAVQYGEDGSTSMRTARSVSKDDDGAVPFVTLDVPMSEADRHANVLFELIDQNGETQLRREQRVYLRDGEMGIQGDSMLSLYDNDHVRGMGDWDLRVSIDGVLVGVHSFALTASSETRARRRRARSDSNTRAAAQRIAADDQRSDDGAMSLEDLLRGQNNNES